MSFHLKKRKLGEQAQFRGVHSMTLLFIYLFITPFNAMSQLIKPIYLFVQITSSFLSPCPHTKASNRPLLLSPLLSERPQLGTLLRPFTLKTPSTWGFFYLGP
jgi:hypothetical protein